MGMSHGRGGQGDLDRRIEVVRELDSLKPWLEAYIAQAVGHAKVQRLLASRDGHSRAPDIQKLVAIMLDNWDGIFGARLRPHIRTYLRELKDIRNRVAHDEPFSSAEVERVRSTVRLVAESLGAPSAPARSPKASLSEGTALPDLNSSPLKESVLAPNAGRSPARDQRTGSGQKRVSYTSTRLLFKALLIEPLEPTDEFEVVTPDGTFVLTKADFYRVFPNVIRSRSYRETGVYHYRKVPVAALEFLISRRR